MTASANISRMLKACALLILLFLGSQGGARAQVFLDTAAIHQAIDHAFAHRLKDPVRSLLEARQLLVLSQRQAYLIGMAQSMHIIADYHLQQADFDSAEYYAVESYKIRKVIGKPDMLASSYRMQMVIAKDRGNYQKALSLNGEHLKLIWALDDRSGIVRSLETRGDIYRAIGLRDSAMWVQSVAFAVEDAPGENPLNRRDILGFANTYQAIGESEKAALHYHKLIGQQVAKGDLVGQAKSWNNLGIALMDLGKYDSAYISLMQAIELKEKLHLKDGLAGCYLNLALVDERQGYARPALKSLQRAFELLEGRGNCPELVSAYINLGLVKSDLNESEASLSAFVMADSLARALNSPPLKVEAREHLIVGYARAGRYAEAYALQDSIAEARMALEHENAKARQRASDWENAQKLTQERLEARTRIYQRDLALLIFVALSIVLGLAFAWAVHARRRRTLLEAKERQLQGRQFKARIVEMELRVLYGKVEAAEATRHQIARDMHDDVKNELAMARNYLQTLTQPVNPTDAERLATALQLLEQAVKKLKEMTDKIHLNLELELSLQEGIAGIVRHIQESAQLEVSCIVTQHPLPRDRQWVTHLMSIVQELCMNVVAHAHATEMTVNVHHKDGVLSLSVEDNGIGFHEKRVNRLVGMGLKNVRSRVAELHGSLRIDSGIGGGTTVFVDIPIPSHRDRAMSPFSQFTIE